MNHLSRAALALIAGTAWGQQPSTELAPKQPAERGSASTCRTMVRPIDMHNTVWIEDMTLLEIRDSIKAGKTTALVMVGGMEDNGPYVTVSQHNSVIRFIGEKIARELGNALCAPVVGMAPGNPEASLEPRKHRSLERYLQEHAHRHGSQPKSRGLQEHFVHGGSRRRSAGRHRGQKFSPRSGKDPVSGPSMLLPITTTMPWRSSSRDVLGVHEKSEGYHDDYYTASISVAIDPNGIVCRNA